MTGASLSKSREVTFQTVLAAEREQIAERRRKLGRAHSGGPPPAREPPLFVGLALSGGGVRAAAFAFGAIEALSNLPVPGTTKPADGRLFSRVDYLSSVSGGSYAACSAVATIVQQGVPSPFAEGGAFSPEAYISSIRSHARILSNRGWVDYLQLLSLWLYGLISGVLTILPFLLAIAAVYVLLLRESTTIEVLTNTLSDKFWSYVTISFVAALGCYAAFAVVYSSRHLRSLFANFGGKWPAVYLLALTLSFLALQPVLVQANMKEGMIYNYFIESSFAFLWQNSFREAAVAAALLFSLVSLFLLLFLKRGQSLNTTPRSVWNRIYEIGSQICLGMILVVAPTFLWSIVLMFTRWGIVCASCAMPKHDAPESISDLAKWLHHRLEYAYSVIGIQSLFSVDTIHIAAANFAALYIALAALLYLFTKYCIDSNSTSFHRFYRGRIKSCFFPEPKYKTDSKMGSASRAATIRVTATQVARSPYLLVNCTLNAVTLVDNELRVVDEPFVVSSRYTGNAAAGYYPTELVELMVGPEFDLATVAAISGAAFSPVMGRYSVPAFRLLMSLLGFRLGYWIPNPGVIRKSYARRWLRGRDIPSVGRRVDGLYFLREMFGTMTSRASCLYITDGGHTDNSGIYELLRRRCTTIIAVDADADTEGLFDNVVYLIEHARVKLRTEIGLSCRTVGVEGGTHCAIGEIRYPHSENGEPLVGRLLYCKLSMTGDENLDLLSRRKASGEFPYNSTLNQNYDQLMFNAYRGLAVHILEGVLSGVDRVELCNGDVRALKDSELTDLFKETS